MIRFCPRRRTSTTLKRTGVLFGLILAASLTCSAAMNSGESSSANAAVSEQLRQAFQQATYRFRAQPDGGYRGVNRAQRLNLEFTSVQPRLTVNGSMSDSVGFRLTGFG